MITGSDALSFLPGESVERLGGGRVAGGAQINENEQRVNREQEHGSTLIRRQTNAP